MLTLLVIYNALTEEQMTEEEAKRNAVLGGSFVALVECLTFTSGFYLGFNS